MDFWDLARLMWRRWYITVPMLVVTAIGALTIVISVGPEYQAVGHVSVVFPTEERQAEAGEVTRVNPFDEVTLVDAARIRLEGKALEDDLAAKGLQAEYAVEIDGAGRTLRIEVVAATAQEALDVVHELQAVAEEEVALRQDAYEVDEGARFNTVVYDQGESVETTASSMRRALVAVVGAGLILTIGTVALVDAVLRRRTRSREPQPAIAPAPAIAAAPAIASEAPPPTSVIPAPPGPRAPVSGSGTASVSASAAAPVRPRYTYSTAARASVSVPPASHEAEEEVPIAGKPPEHGERPRDDSTIVIPLASASWPRSNGDRANGSGGQDHSGGAHQS